MTQYLDASPKAYGACTYLGAVDINGNCSTKIIVAKSRVTPTKALTMPKLELVGPLVTAGL